MQCCEQALRHTTLLVVAGQPARKDRIDGRRRRVNSENMVSIAHTIHNKEPCSHDSTRGCMQVAWILAAWRFGCTLSVLSTLRIFTAPGLIECHAASSSDARMYACSARWAFFVSTPFRLSATGRYIYEQMEKVVVPRAP